MAAKYFVVQIEGAEEDVAYKKRFLENICKLGNPSESFIITEIAPEIWRGSRNEQVMQVAIDKIKEMKDGS